MTMEIGVPVLFPSKILTNSILIFIVVKVALYGHQKVKEEKALQNKSTDIDSPISIVFSEVKNNLLRLDVNWNFKEETNKFQLLLYFDDNLIGISNSSAIDIPSFEIIAFIQRQIFSVFSSLKG